MRLALLIFSVFIGGCSCQRTPLPGEVAPPPAAITAAALPAEPAATDGGDAAATNPAALAGTAQSSATSTLHGYLQALLHSGRAGSDSFWSGGRAPPHPDDSALRALLVQVQDLRIDSDSARPLDQEHPPQTVEIPVRLRVLTRSGTAYLQGYYRLRQRLDGSGWEITSAALQPVLD